MKLITKSILWEIKTEARVPEIILILHIFNDLSLKTHAASLIRLTTFPEKMKHLWSVAEKNVGTLLSEERMLRLGGFSST